jgi:hypothetical protein
MGLRADKQMCVSFSLSAWELECLHVHVLVLVVCLKDARCGDDE